MPSRCDRAKLFLPFDALKGFREALREKEKIVVPKITLSDDDIDIINKKLMTIKPCMIVEITYYNESEYINISGIVSKVDELNKYIVIVKNKILFSDILKLEIVG